MPTDLLVNQAVGLLHAFPDYVLATMPTEHYEKIRVIAYVSAGEDGPTEITVANVIEDGPGGVLDTFSVDPGQTVTRVYEVPGVRTTVAARASRDADSGLDLFVYAWRPEPGPAPQPAPSQVGRFSVAVWYAPDGEQPAPGIAVWLLLPDGSGNIDLGVTDENGMLSGRPVVLPEGTWALTFGSDEALAVTADLTVVADTDNQLTVMVPRAAFRATVILQQQDGSQTAVAGATVSLDGVGIGTTDESGVLVGHTTDGEHTLDVTTPDGLTAQTSFSVALGEVADVSVGVLAP